MEGLKKLNKYIHRICDFLELVVAVLVLAGIILTMFSFLRDFNIFRELADKTSVFQQYLERIFVIVIGIEFLKMLSSPNSDNVLEILIFLVARHMVVGETTPYEDFASVVGVVLLCLARRYLHKDHAENASSSGDT
ncbi:MAG: hypothetical protein NC337_14540 [Roseburia sp.]|nr:hypothetical protein [Roseburia sp.]